jgi:hypothetical protein
MRKIVYPIAAVIIMFFVLLLVAMTLSPNWSVQRRVYINVKPPDILPYVQNLEKWKTWNTWAARRGITSIALTCKLPQKTTCVVTMEGNRTIEECLVMLIPADYGAYVVLKVSGKMHENPFMRYIMEFHNDTMGEELEQNLVQLKKMLEKKL